MITWKFRCMYHQSTEQTKYEVVTRCWIVARVVDDPTYIHDFSLVEVEFRKRVSDWSITKYLNVAQNMTSAQAIRHAIAVHDEACQIAADGLEYTPS